MMFLPPPGTPYHRLARTVTHRWWLPPVGTLVVIVGSAAAGCLLICGSLVTGSAAGRPERDGLPTFGPVGDTALVLAFIAAALPVVLLTARWLQRRPAGTVSSVTGRLRLRWLGMCLLVATPAIILLILGLFALLATFDAAQQADADSGRWVGWPGFAAALAVLVVLVPLQAAAEEYLCRGWLLQAVGAYTRGPWLAIVVQAVVFAAAHGWGTPWGFADLTLGAVVTGWLTVRTGGLEAAVALHLMNNLTVFVFAAAFGELDSTGTAADAGWHLLAVSLPVTVAYAAVICRFARRLRVATATPAEPATAEPAAPVAAGDPGGAALPAPTQPSQ